MPVTDYYDLEQKKLLLASEEVGLFTKHPVTIGTFRERCLRDYLRKHVAKRFALANGFVVDHEQSNQNIVDRSSLQIDCLAFDEVDFAPLLRTDDFACVVPAAVIAAIEIKSELRLHRSFARDSGGISTDFPFEIDGKGYRWAGTLVDAVENIRSVNRLFYEPEDPTPLTHFSGVFGYQGAGVDSVRDPQVWTQIIKQLCVSHVNELPEAICILEKGWWNFSAYDLSYGDCVFDPGTIYLNCIPSAAGQIGAPLQIFTSVLAHFCSVRIAKEAHRVGGLRSGVGANSGETSEKLSLSSVGYGPCTY
jgi:hypothetical protein